MMDLQEPRRTKFLAAAWSSGVAWLLDFSNHAGRLAGLVTLLIGVSVAGFLTRGGPVVAAVAIVVLLGFALFQGAFLTWAEVDRQRRLALAGRSQESRSLLTAILSVMMELDYIENRIEEGPLNGEALPNVEWVRHKNRIASARGDVMSACHQAYKEADWLNRNRHLLAQDDYEEVERIVNDALAPIREAQEVLGDWENEILKAEAGSS